MCKMACLKSAGIDVDQELTGLYSDDEKNGVVAVADFPDWIDVIALGALAAQAVFWRRFRPTRPR
jgi:hypothetical protein